MLKIIVLSQVLIANKLLATNRINSIKDGNKLIEKFGKLLKTGESSKSLKLS